MIACPNVNAQEFKDLAKELGDDLAKLAFHRKNAMRFEIGW